MYPSKQAFLDGASSISCWPFYIDVVEAPEMETGYSVVDKYLYYVTTKVKESLEGSYPSSTFEITGIPTEAPVVVEPTPIIEQLPIEETPVEEVPTEETPT
jgi:hypothetical protein